LTWCRTCTAGTYFPSLPISCSPAICTLAQSSIPMPTLPHLHSHVHSRLNPPHSGSTH
jgi:hypothetical protein